MVGGPSFELDFRREKEGKRKEGCSHLRTYQIVAEEIKDREIITVLRREKVNTKTFATLTK